MRRILWWRFWFDTFRVNYDIKWAQYVAVLTLPCAPNYRSPRAVNDNRRQGC